MKLASFKIGNSITWGMIENEEAIDVGALLRDRYPDLKSAIAADALSAVRDATGKAKRHPTAGITWLPVIPNPDKILCIGLNYETHRKETEGQVDRLDQVFKTLDVAARGKKCDAIEGIIAEAKEHMEEIEDKQVLDAGMIGSAQAVEHYEICRYGTLIEWAKDLGHNDAVGLLQQNLDEEKNADRLLSQIAKSSTNRKAMAAE